MNIRPVLICLVLSGCSTNDPDATSHGLGAAPAATSATSGFHHPESALWDAGSKTWFVSNVGEFDTPGDGFISRLNAKGELDELRFVEGLDDPKGLAVLGDHLYVADLGGVMQIDLKAPSAVVRIEVPEAVFLNDLAADVDGDALYVSDSFGNAIFRIEGTKVETVVRDPALETPNGLVVDGSTLYVGSVGPDPDPTTFMPSQPGRLLALDLDTGSFEPVTDRFASLDGVVMYEGEFLASDTFVGVHHVTREGDTELYVDAAALELQGAADIGFDPEARRLAVPQLFGDTVSFFTFE